MPCIYLYLLEKMAVNSILKRNALVHENDNLKSEMKSLKRVRRLATRSVIPRLRLTGGQPAYINGEYIPRQFCSDGSPVYIIEQDLTLKDEPAKILMFQTKCDVVECDLEPLPEPVLPTPPSNANRVTRQNPHSRHALDSTTTHHWRICLLNTRDVIDRAIQRFLEADVHEWCIHGTNESHLVPPLDPGLWRVKTGPTQTSKVVVPKIEFHTKRTIK